MSKSDLIQTCFGGAGNSVKIVKMQICVQDFKNSKDFQAISMNPLISVACFDGVLGALRGRAIFE